MQKLYNKFINSLTLLEDIAPLMLRLLLAYVFYGTAMEKIGGIDSITAWFEHLGIPFPALNAYLSAITETAGFILLFLGLGTRLISIPLIIILLVAILTIHFDNGWLVIGSRANDPEIASRVGKAVELLKEHGHYDWLTEKGPFVILQNGMEFAVTYIAMLLSLIAFGPGRISVDALIKSKFKK